MSISFSYLYDVKFILPLLKVKNPAAIKHKSILTEQDHWYRFNIKKGQKVLIVLKKDQRTGKLTQGIVKDILTSSPKHTRGIKVRLTNNKVGRVQKIL
jgi:uncharacterized repeat protein (TIGR03833 family)